MPPMRRCIYRLISSAKLLIASWYAALRFWAETPRHARTDIISAYGTTPANIGCVLSALTYRFKNGFPRTPIPSAACVLLCHVPVAFTVCFCFISNPCDFMIDECSNLMDEVWYLHLQKGRRYA